MKIKTVIIQLEAIPGDIEGNIKKINSLLIELNKKSIDLIVLPELWTTGWDCINFNKYSEDLYSSKTYSFLNDLSRKYNANVIGGSSIIKREGTKDRNCSLIFNRKGELKAIYDKYHLFSHRGQSEGKYLEEGITGILVNLDIGKVGISTCYDIRFPELFRKYALKGADLIVNMAAWPLGFFQEYETLLHARAIENQLYFISSCLTGKINDNYLFSGNSQVCDYRGNIIAKLAREEKALYTEIDINKMAEYRQNMPILYDTKSEYKIMEIE